MLCGFLDLGNGASKCNTVSFGAFAMCELLHGSFFTNIDGDFISNENIAKASMPTNTVQSHVNTIS